MSPRESRETATSAPPSARADVAWQILDLARWAPSGDNTQPWRFEVRGDDHVVVHAFDTRGHCVYDIDGRASQVSVGALLETVRIAATVHGRTAEVVRRRDGSDEFPVFDVRLVSSRGVSPDPLHAWIRSRSVQRRPLETRPLVAAEKRSLAAAIGPRHSVVWFEGWQQRWRMAWLATRSAKIRLTIPEAYVVHRDVIAWDSRFSDDRIPDMALGASAMSLRSMRWAMSSWQRVRCMNRYAAGTWAPRLELDLLPGLRCAAHFAIVAEASPVTIDDYLAAGAATQRFWLMATALGLQLQPQYTPLVFAAYARRQLAFTGVSSARARADAVRRTLDRLLGTPTADAAVFLGRVGHGPSADCRSLRLPLTALTWSEPSVRRGHVSEKV
ncbi:MAG TPA: molybdopterin biosynthesis protein MoeY [Caldimonas sp.]|jgi:nitroreductase|nr:molybdopterin biosynthesis protein MoeY [Caldimonas sp.]HEX2539559.1 molybdopterin biosynthesis protein MoeY [Caldimonas sp.]